MKNRKGTNHCSFKLVRNGENEAGLFSLDDKVWNDLNPLQAKLGSNVKVGVAVVHDTECEFKPIFSYLSVE